MFCCIEDDLRQDIPVQVVVCALQRLEGKNNNDDYFRITGKRWLAGPVQLVLLVLQCVFTYLICATYFFNFHLMLTFLLVMS